ncbi:MAG TPA: hypothetical protein ENI81_06560, partial [Phycisphaerales bacterium]|nr:hypothetical protein [Phycisphaerales bacterium]
MPLNVRSVAVSIAVICFFLMSLIGWASGLTPFVCCKRALIGAVLVYLGGSWAVRAINSILVNAMIANRVDEQAEDDFAETASVA